VRLIAAELLSLRKRAATYVVLAVLLVLMALVYLLSGLTVGDRSGPDASSPLRFPAAYALIGLFVFNLGSLLAVAYAAAVAGGDWSWGIPRVVLGRGESRVNYVLAKAAALAIALAIGVLIAYAAGIALTYVSGAISGTNVGNPLAGNGPRRLADSLLLGFPVLIERAAIGFAVATVLRSQLAGVVVGIVLYIGETILAGIMVALALSRAAFGDAFNFEPFGPEWYQFLPFSIGGEVLSAATGGPGPDPGVGDVFLRNVQVEVALAGVLLYLLVAMAVSALLVRRAEITA
jgi:ABC-type transport system involved in multi-copper enzyme maturation permease subunit